MSNIRENDYIRLTLTRKKDEKTDSVTYRAVVKSLKGNLFIKKHDTPTRHISSPFRIEFTVYLTTNSSKEREISVNNIQSSWGASTLRVNHKLPDLGTEGDPFVEIEFECAEDEVSLPL